MNERLVDRMADLMAAWVALSMAAWVPDSIGWAAASMAACMTGLMSSSMTGRAPSAFLFFLFGARPLQKTGAF